MTDTPPSRPKSQLASPDFIFGTLGTDEQRLADWKARQEGLTHNYELTPIDPRPQQPIRVEVTAGPTVPISDVFIHYTTDGSRPEIGGSLTRIASTTRGEIKWNTPMWGYVRTFSGEIPAQGQGTIVRYVITGMRNDSKRIFAHDATGRAVFSFAVDRYAVPTWLEKAVFYHIFVDRFAPSPDRQFAKPAKLDGFFGGTLRGILAKLDYLCKLGVNALWLSPIFPSPSHHGYDATDFRNVEPRLGNKTDLRNLVQELHKRDMKIILDFIPNHTSNLHPFFEAAQRDMRSPYYPYYVFNEHPDEYDTFFGVKNLPKLNNENAATRKYVIESALYWMQEFGIDGFRLDYAQGPSRDFFVDYYAAVKAANPESIHFGEIVESPSTLATYEGVLDGLLDFTWMQFMRKLFAFGEGNVTEFDQFQNAHEVYFSRRNLARFSFLDNHDMNRFLWAAGGDIARLKLAAVSQLTLTATPIIYYGTEIGLSQQRDIRQGDFGIFEEARLPMEWDEKKHDKELFELYRKLIALRKQVAALRQGTRWAWLVNPETGCYGYLRRSSTDTAAVAFNLGPKAQIIDMPSAQWKDAFTGEALPAKLNLPSMGFMVALQK
jgi:cyclomaltodextrinase / maltogenic alpha-amylase / neopullulanase